jgi:hypothetical protein
MFKMPRQPTHRGKKLHVCSFTKEAPFFLLESTTDASNRTKLVAELNIESMQAAVKSEPYEPLQLLQTDYDHWDYLMRNSNNQFIPDLSPVSGAAELKVESRQAAVYGHLYEPWLQSVGLSQPKYSPSNDLLGTYFARNPGSGFSGSACIHHISYSGGIAVECSSRYEAM